MSISALLGDAGERLTVEHGGKAYKAGPITQRVKSAWERALMDEATEALHRVTKGMPADVQGAAAADLAARCSGGEFAFYGHKSLAALQSFGGQIRLASLLFGVPEDEAEALMLARPAQVAAVIDTVTNESFGAVIAFGRSQKAGGEGAEGKAPPTPPTPSA